MYTQEQVHQVRDMVQNMAYRAWENAGRKGTIVMATGVGKSKLAVRRVAEIYNEWDMEYVDLPRPEILLVTPTEKLRDENWPDEFTKWGAAGYMENLVKRICFASLKAEKGNRYKLVILDEIHRLTSNNSEPFLDAGSLTQFLADNICEEVMGLTATEPDPDRDRTKFQIVQQIARVCFRYTLEQAIADGLTPDFKLQVILVPLERVVRNIEAGKKGSKFLTTEAAHYEYLNKKCKVAFASKKPGFIHATIGTRTRFLTSLPSKTRVARKLLERVLPTGRTIVFCGGIEQSRNLCGENVYNSSPEDKKRDMLTKFKNKEIDYLGVVNAVNEGHNIADIDNGVAVQVNGNERDLIQRLGRLLRYRPGYTPTFYILIAQGTQDQEWLNAAVEGIDRKRIVYDSYLNYL